MRPIDESKVLDAQAEVERSRYMSQAARIVAIENWIHKLERELSITASFESRDIRPTKVRLIRRDRNDLTENEGW